MGEDYSNPNTTDLTSVAARLAGSATTQFTVRAGSKVHVTGHSTFFNSASTGTPTPASIVVSICYDDDTAAFASPTVAHEQFVLFDSTGSAQRQAVSINGVFTFSAAGTYRFGFCGRSSSAQVVSSQRAGVSIIVDF
jgi:hypothetical protein